MKLRLAGFTQYLEIKPGSVAVLEVSDRILFSRVTQSLLSEQGELSVEPFFLLDDDMEEISPRNAFLFIFNPFDLPWSERTLLGKVFDQMEDMLLLQDDERQGLESAGRVLSDKVLALSHQFRSEYSFEIEWDIRKYTKAFDFGVDVDPSDPLLDNLIKFLNLACDASFDRVLVFVNLKNFLALDDLKEFYRHVVFSERKVLLLENAQDEAIFEEELKMFIDQDLLESLGASPVTSPSFSSEDFAPTVLEQ